MYDYGWRQYMPDIGRWYGMDQLGEHPYQIDKSPYAFTWNNPVKLVDQDGLCPDCPDPTKADEIVNHSNGNQYFSVETSGGFKWVQVQDIQEVIVGGGSGSSSSGFYLGIGFLGMGSGGSGSASVGGWGIYGGGALFPIKQRPVDDIEEQMIRKQQLEYERLQNSKIDDIATGLGINMNLKEGLTDLAKKIANGNIGKSGENFLKSTKILG